MIKKNSVNSSLAYISHEKEAINCFTQEFTEANLVYCWLLFSSIWYLRSGCIAGRNL